MPAVRTLDLPPVILLTAEYYYSKTTDMLYAYEVPVPPFAYNTLLANIGSMSNRGFELGLSVQPICKKDLDLNINMNLSFQSNKLISLSGDYKGMSMSAANIIGYFLARRDIDELSQEAMQAQIGQPQADVLIAFGGMIPHGCDIVARSFQRGLAKRLLLVGGIGHTTEVVRAAYKDRVPELDVDGRAEADIMADYLKLCYVIGSDCYISNVCTMETTEGATYGEGNIIAVLNEVGDGNVMSYHGLTSQMAALMVRHASDRTFRKAIRRLIDEECDTGSDDDQ